MELWQRPQKPGKGNGMKEKRSIQKKAYTKQEKESGQKGVKDMK